MDVSSLFTVSTISFSLRRRRFDGVSKESSTSVVPTCSEQPASFSGDAREGAWFSASSESVTLLVAIVILTFTAGVFTGDSGEVVVVVREVVAIGVTVVVEVLSTLLVVDAVVVVVEVVVVSVLVVLVVVVVVVPDDEQAVGVLAGDEEDDGEQGGSSQALFPISALCRC